jgi:hypothetical protein
MGPAVIIKQTRGLEEGLKKEGLKREGSESEKQKKKGLGLFFVLT